MERIVDNEMGGTPWTLVRLTTISRLIFNLLFAVLIETGDFLWNQSLFFQKKKYNRKNCCYLSSLDENHHMWKPDRKKHREEQL
jgi:hypothetical protein